MGMSINHSLIKAKKCTPAQLKKLAGEALKQINSKRYDAILKKRNLSSILQPCIGARP